MQKLTNYPSSLLWYAKLGSGITGLVVARHFSKVTKDWILSSANKNADFANFWRSIAKNCNNLPSKFQCKNWPFILHLWDGMQNLALVLPVWLWCVISQKWQKRTGFCHQRLKTLILPIFSGQLRKIVMFYLPSLNAKTDWLSFLFAMVCQTWWWYYWFSRGI